MLAALPETVRARLATVRAESADSIELDLTDGVVVVWGSAEQNDRKAEVLVALMKQPGRVYIVSAPEAPAIRP
jgi:cell division protein FtsQ